MHDNGREAVTSVILIKAWSCYGGNLRKQKDYSGVNTVNLKGFRHEEVSNMSPILLILQFTFNTLWTSALVDAIFQLNSTKSIMFAPKRCSLQVGTGEIEPSPSAPATNQDINTDEFACFRCLARWLHVWSSDLTADPRGPQQSKDTSFFYEY